MPSSSCHSGCGADRFVLTRDPGDERLGFVGLAHGRADHPLAFLPRQAVVEIVGGLRDRGRDRGERLVLVFGHAGRHADDEIGAERGDRFVVDLAAVEDLGLGVAERVLCPGPHRVRLVAVPVPDADRHDPEREQEVLIGVADRHDPLGLGLHGGRAVLVLDGDRERVARRGRGRRTAAAGRGGIVAVRIGATRDEEADRDQGDGDPGENLRGDHLVKVSLT